MSAKTYKRIKILAAIIIATVFSQSYFTQNYIIPVATLIVIMLLLMYLRSQVKEIMADERDYQMAGKSALFTIQIYSWINVIVMLFLFSQKHANPLYEPIGTTIAFSICFLMLIYSVIFRIKNAK